MLKYDERNTFKLRFFVSDLETYELPLYGFEQSGHWLVDAPVEVDVHNDGGTHQLFIRLPLRRVPYFQVIVIIFPIFLLSLLGSCLVLIPFSGGEKVSSSLTVLLAFIVELVVVAELVPPSGQDDLPAIIVTLVLCIGFSFLSVSVAAVLTSIHSKKTNFPEFCKRFLQSRIIRTISSRAVADSTSDDVADKRSREENEKSIEMSVQQLEQQARGQCASGEQCENEQLWKLLAEVLNRIYFFIYSFSIIIAIIIYMLY